MCINGKKDGDAINKSKSSKPTPKHTQRKTKGFKKVHAVAE